MLNKLLRFLDQLIAIARLPVVRLQFHLVINPENVRKIHAYYTKPHPRYRVFAHKSLGAALVDLTRFRHRDDYLQRIKARKELERHVRRARSRGYAVVEIDRNRFIDDIFEINNAIEVRQGRPMDEDYRKKKDNYPSEVNYKHYGVLNPQGKLVAYGDLGFYGNFAAFTRVIGLRNNDGIVHLMVTEIIGQLIDGGKYEYLMYDTYFGASDGLRKFKTLLGFAPYRAKYSLQ